MNSRTVNSSKIRKLIIISGIIISTNFVFNCFDPVKLNHPDDPYSESFIIGKGYECPQSAISKISSNSAKLFWEWSDSAYSLLQDHGDFVRIKRLTKHNLQSSLYRLDTVFQLTPNEIVQDSNNVCPSKNNTVIVSWVDSTLIIENDYRYIVKIGNSVGLAKDSVTFDYSHIFSTPDSFNIKQVYSDTSIQCTWSNPNRQQIDSIKIQWIGEHGSVFIDTTLGAKSDTIYLTKNDIELNQLTTVSFWYGLNSADSIIWQRIPFETNYTMKFDSVNNVFAVCYQKDLVRITWEYDSDKVQPTEFSILEGANVIGKVTNRLQSKIKIDGKRYFVFFDSTSKTEFSIIPQTKYHNGDTINVAATDVNNQIDGFTYVDRLYKQGFYISLFEMTIGQFIHIYNMHTLPYYGYNADTLRLEGLIQINDDSTLSLNPQSDSSLPIEWISWDLANSLAIANGDSLPSDEEWRLAARAGSGDLRIYPWGDSSPSNLLCNFNGDSSFVVDTLENGRVDVYEYRNMKGPYHMEGNVKEWTSDPVTLRNLLGAHHARGGSWWDTNESKLQIGDESCIFTISDKVGGIRLKKIIR